ncbi:MAG: radical SAM protein, partial [Spirochaetia bacterium]|nr:radical SAM protein [Spirochaetia bacterium]
QSRKYLPLSLVQFSRGCRYRCDFCSIQNFYSRKNSQFLIENVIADVESAKNRWIFFVDDNILGDIKKLKEFLKELIPLKISWMTQISIDFADDEELMNLMTESGCRAVILGLETLNQKTIRQMKKNWARVGSYSERLKKIQSAGIMIYGSFVFGYDADRSDDISYTLEFALEQKMLLANFNMLQPYPGTSLYDRLKKEGRLMYEAWWLDENYRYGDVVFHPRGMSAEELSEGCRKARHAFHSYSSIAKRFFNFQSHLIHYRNAFLYAIVNYSSRQDVIKKEGMRLGASVS